MPDAHAKLSPSAAERWLACPASIRMEAQVPPEQESSYAREGTVAHTLAELKASLAFGKITKAVFTKRHARWYRENEDLLTDEVEIEMERHTDAYVALLQERMALYPNSVLFLEQRLDTGVPSCWGTSDAVIVSPQHVEIVDFKYGAGVAVEAHGNPQLRLYACGAMDTYAGLLGDTEVIRITVHQPRMDHILTEEITPEALDEWRRVKVIPVADVALNDPDAPFGPSDEACRWCPASGRCRAQLEAVFAQDFEVKPDVLEPEEVAEVLAKTKMVEDWLNAFKEAALDRAYSGGETIPGYKVVLSGGKRSVRDNERALEALRALGFDDSEVAAVKVKGIGDLEKLLGKEKFEEVLEKPGIVAKSDGKPALVPESDGRPAIAPNSEAAKVFQAEDLI